MGPVERLKHFFGFSNVLASEMRALDPDSGELPLRGELSSVEQLAQHARTMAEGQQLIPSGNNNFLLERLNHNDAVLRDFNQAALVARKPKFITPAAEWLMDNFYLVEEHIQLARRHFPKKYSRELPCLAEGASRGLPRVYAVVLEFIAHVDAQIDEESLHVFFDAYQTGSVLQLGELWAVPIMLRLALIENLQRIATRVRKNQLHREMANAWVDKLQQMAGESPSRLVEVVADMAKANIPLSSAFVSAFCLRLSSLNPVLHMARTWLEQRLAEEGLSIERLIHAESQSQAANQVSVSHSFRSLRFLGTADWKAFVESLSAVERTLRKVPGDIYHLMDFTTRDRYRHVVEALARRSALTEVAVAQHAVRLAQEAHARGLGPRHSHVGYYLIGEGKLALARAIEIKPSFASMPERMIHRFPLTFYMGGIGLLSLAGTFAFAQVMLARGALPGDWKFIVLLLLFLLCASQLAVASVNWLAMLFVKPHLLPRLDFSDGITPECRTVVVVPTMLSSQKAVDRLIESIELHHLSNTDEMLHFALLTDFKDAPQEVMPEDAALLERARAGIAMLNRQHAPDRNNLFFLCHRPRCWNASEGVWMGRERKRGKLMAFNALLRSGNGAGDFSLIEGDAAILGSVKYVITLDTDTQLPRDAARKLAGTMAHPLNRPEFDPERNVVINGYGILQPRVSASLPSSQRSAFARLFSGESGIDPYTRAISDVYQDVFHEGSFIGKGIYDLDAFEQALGGRFPENRILSHDLLESAYVRSALISDVEVHEGFPSGYTMDANRRHRWIRGDWQIAQWLLPRVPVAGGAWVANPLSGLAKWKLFDNLRRSLMSPALVLFLAGTCLFFPHSGWLAPLLVLVMVALPIVLGMSTGALGKSRDHAWLLHLREVGRKGWLQCAQVLLSLVLLPHDAYLCADATLRTGWRLVVTRRHLLEWQTSVDAERAACNSLGGFYAAMWFAPFFALVCGGLLAVLQPMLLPYALPALLAWMAAPGVAWRISRHIAPHAPVFSAEQTLLLHRIARKTWHFFDTLVTADENWLPPDNFQEVPEPLVASRTSPTNMGLSLLANLAAFDFGYLPAGQVIARTDHSLATMGKLKKYRGHFYNWYDTRTLEPLPPLYVSSVDSGNLAGHLLVLGQGLRELKDAPVHSPHIFAGLLDTVRMIHPLAGNNVVLSQLEADLMKPPPATLREAYAWLENIAEKAGILRRFWNSADEALRQWGQILQRDCEAHRDELLSLAPWVRIAPALSAAPEKIRGDAANAILASLAALEKGPTLRELSQSAQRLCPLIEEALAAVPAARAGDNGSASDDSHFLAAWLRCLRQAGNVAAQRMEQLDALAHQCDSLARMDFAFLYNPDIKLFTIGFNVPEQRMDVGSYDLLASEARLCSYVAIAQGQVPQEHWFSLSRLLVVSQGDPVLLSWSGSMFEYLMPLLVMPNFEDTLLDHTCKAAVQEQIEYGRNLGVPWGISESGYNRTDAHMNYQYRAFGIPSLGLKRGLSQDLVIAPYATLMALMVAPREACENMQRLSAEGREGVYGYYEAIDYTPAHLRPDETSVVVQSFMAHHQGMSLLSLVNLMRGGSMQRRFTGCPMLKSAELLLQERISRNITANRISDDSKFELEGLHPLLADNSEVMRIFKDTTIAPEVHLLSNGRYHVMVSNAGGGYSRWRDIAVTRWREDATRDCWGLFTYLRDCDSGEFWSTAHQPTLRNAKGYEAIFSQAYAEFRQRQPGLEMHTRICVSPEDDVELRRITLSNRSHLTRTIELTTYSEVVIAPQADDEAHPAFSNLFVQTEFVPDSSALFCTRRARSTNETPPHLLHLLLVQGEPQGDITCETDRSRFIGRGRSLSSPQALQNTGPLSNTSGSVLDPIIALRRTVVIRPGKTVTLCIVLGMADTRAGALALADKYQNPRITDRAIELAWTHSQIVLHQLTATEAESQLYGRLAGALIYANPARRAAPAVLKNNRRAQSGLWSYSISGDAPLVLVRINESTGIGLLRQVVLAHAYWRLKGLTVELVILNEDVSVYRQSLHDEITNLISSGIEAPLLDKPGGIFVRRIEQIPREDLILMQAVARIVLDDRLGTLAAQLALRPIAEPQVPAFKSTRTAFPEAPRALPARDLIFFNGLGGFTPDGREYIITLEPGQATPAPWCNVLANEKFGSVISESGGAYTWATNAHEFRITPWNNDSVQDASGEAFYIRDEQTGLFWSPTPLPARGATPYVVRHGFGYTVFEHSEHGIESELWVYVAIDAPVKFAVLKLRNISGRPRRISATGYYEWVLADLRHKSLLHVQTKTDLETGALIARNFYHNEFSGQIAFIDVGEAHTASGDRKEFIGQNGSLAKPAAMKRTRLSGKTGAGLDPCGAMQVTFDLAAGGEREIRFRLGFARNKEELHQLVSRFQHTGAARKALEHVWAYWNRTLGTVNVDTPDASVNMMANGWLLYQTLSARLWGRSGFYQSGGAYGFRDQLQDVMALVHAEPALARRQILRAARRQFREGDVQHWWHPPSGRGVRTHFSDDYLWLPYATFRYVTTVADTGILDESVPFLEGRPLRPDEESYYDLPGRSDETATLYEHCVRSIENGLKFGAHGLPLIGCGDWNDGMNLVGKDGRGESVWLAFFLHDVLVKFSKLATLRHDTAFAERCLEQAWELKRNIKQHAWDGAWYRRAYFDNGEPLGSNSNEECRIDSLPQSWSVISGAGSPERSAQAMAQVSRQLVRTGDKLIQLFTPPFDTSALDPGYIKGYIPGVRENGGQYTHGAIWTAMAFALMGETDYAWELFALLNPIQHGRTPGQIAIYKVEPYVVAADVYAAAPHIGRGGWTWYTGSSAWMYRLLVETLLGVNREGDKLHLTPRLPQKWNTCKVHYRYGQTVYHITFNRLTDHSPPRLLLDGQELPDHQVLPLADDNREHFVEMWIEP